MFDKKTLNAFIDRQGQLFDRPVCDDEQSAREFLEEMCAVVAEDFSEVREYLEEEMDITGMSDEELLSSGEVFDIGDGRYLIVEG